MKENIAIHTTRRHLRSTIGKCCRIMGSPYVPPTLRNECTKTDGEVWDVSQASGAALHAKRAALQKDRASLDGDGIRLHPSPRTSNTHSLEAKRVALADKQLPESVGKIGSGLLDNAIGILFSYGQCRFETHCRERNLSVPVPYVANPMQRQIKR